MENINVITSPKLHDDPAPGYPIGTTPDLLPSCGWIKGGGSARQHSQAPADCLINAQQSWRTSHETTCFRSLIQAGWRQQLCGFCDDLQLYVLRRLWCLFEERLSSSPICYPLKKKKKNKGQLLDFPLHPLAWRKVSLKDSQTAFMSGTLGCFSRSPAYFSLISDSRTAAFIEVHHPNSITKFIPSSDRNQTECELPSSCPSTHFKLLQLS